MYDASFQCDFKNYFECFDHSSLLLSVEHYFCLFSWILFATADDGLQFGATYRRRASHHYYCAATWPACHAARVRRISRGGETARGHMPRHHGRPPAGRTKAAPCRHGAFGGGCGGLHGFVPVHVRSTNGRSRESTWPGAPATDRSKRRNLISSSGRRPEDFLRDPRHRKQQDLPQHQNSAVGPAGKRSCHQECGYCIERFASRLKMKSNVC